MTTRHVTPRIPMSSGSSRDPVRWPRFCGIVLLGLAAAWAGARAIHGAMADRETGAISEPALLALGTLPPFALTERSEHPVTLVNLRGFVWIATFFFSRCGDTCPLQIERMAALGAEFSPASRLRMVAITVDPAYDTPAVLTAYADHLALDRDRFLVLTGDRGTIAGLARQGFKLAVGEVEGGRGDGGLLVAHSDRLALVDGDGQLRDTYPTRDPEALARLRRDLRELLDMRAPSSTAGSPGPSPSTHAARGTP